MGVDLDITSAVGIVLDTEAFDAWCADIDPEGSYYGEEYLYEAFGENARKGIGFGTAGSYYDSEPNIHYLYINRLTKTFDVYHIDGGIIEGPRDASGEPTQDEKERLWHIANVMGTKTGGIKRFTGVLWC